MAKAVITSTFLRGCGLLKENLKPHLAEMPQVAPLQAELDTLVAEASSLDREQEQVRARLREIVQRRRELEQTGLKLRRRVEAHLRGTFGFTNEKLIEFGIKPRPRIVRRKAGEAAEKRSPAQAAAGTAAAPATPQQ